MVHEALEQRRGFHHQHQLGLRLEPQVFHPRRNAPRAAAQLRAVDLHVRARLRILVDHRDLAADVAAALLGDVAQLLAVHAQHGLDVVQQRVALRLLVEPAFAPALAVVIHFALAGDVVLVQQVVLRRRQQPHRLRERLDGVVGQRPRRLLAQDLEMPALGVELHVRQRPHRKAHFRLPVLLHDVVVDFPRHFHDLPRRGFLRHHFGRLGVFFAHRSTSFKSVFHAARRRSPVFPRYGKLFSTLWKIRKGSWPYIYDFFVSPDGHALLKFFDWFSCGPSGKIKNAFIFQAFVGRP